MTLFSQHCAVVSGIRSWPCTVLIALENHPVRALGLLIYKVTQLLCGSTSNMGPVHN